MLTHNAFILKTLIQLSHEMNTTLLKFEQISSTDTTTEVTIPECKLNHSGQYIITASNKAGTKVVKVRVAVLGKTDNAW